MINKFIKIVYTDRGTTYMKHIRQDLVWRLGPIPQVDCSCRGQSSLSSEYGHITY